MTSEIVINKQKFRESFFLREYFIGIFVILFIVGCGDLAGKDGINGTSITPTEFDKTGAVQGGIYDAITGKGIGGNDLQVYLVQGIYNRIPDKLVTDSNNLLVGEYAFANVPVEINTNNNIFKIVIYKPGYQLFEAEFKFTAITGATLRDAVYNKICNIYLFPIGAQAGDITIYVKSPLNKPVPNATVILEVNTNSNVITTPTITAGTNSGTGDTRLYPTGGLVGSLNGTTDVDGKTVFAGTNLTIGGNYTPYVLPITFDGQELGLQVGTAITVGTSSSDQSITMAVVLQPTLYVVSATNSTAGTIIADGKLTLIFNRPIIIDTTTTSWSATATDGVLATNTVTPSLSTDGLTLTLIPNFSTAPTAKGASITYSYNGMIYIKDTQSNSGMTFNGTATDLTTISGAIVSRTVQMISW